MLRAGYGWSYTGNALKGVPGGINAIAESWEIAAERLFSREHLVKHDAECPDISTTVHGLALHLFRRHVCGRSKNDVGFRRSTTY